jgi:hypothetical protein
VAQAAAVAAVAAVRGTPSRAALVLHRLPSAPMACKQLLLIRHGESRWNEAKQRFRVRTLVLKSDHPLSEAGIEQALSLQVTCTRTRAAPLRTAHGTARQLHDTAAGGAQPRRGRPRA